LVGYSDNDWCRDVDDQKSTSGYVFFLGDTTFIWLSKKQPVVTLSTCEAEYVATGGCVSCDLIEKIVEGIKFFSRECHANLLGQQINDQIGKESYPS
jgi:hypothetical protein